MKSIIKFKVGKKRIETKPEIEIPGFACKINIKKRG